MTTAFNMNNFATVLVALAMLSVGNSAADFNERKINFVINNIGTGQKLWLHASANSTVAQIRQLVHDRVDVRAKQDRKVLLYNGQVLSDKRSLEGYDISDRSELQLAICEDVYKQEMAHSYESATSEASEQSANEGTRIFVKYLESGNVFPIKFHVGKTVRSLKEQIQAMGVSHFPPSTQVLLSNRSNRLLKDDKALAYYGVEEDYTIGVVVCKKQPVDLEVQ